MPLPSNLYDEDYFLSDRCEGWARFKEGRGLSPLKATQLRAIDPRPGMRVLDAGCGRGEVLLACAQAGAQVAGLDYSEAAIEIANDVLSGVEGTDLRQGDVTALPWPDEHFDRVLFGDVIEHLDPDQAVAALREFRRVLQPEGILLVHTAPNLLFLKVTWPMARMALRAAGRGATATELDEWTALSRTYHVNEQSLHSLRRALREAGFPDARVWIDPDVLRSGDHHLTQGLRGSLLLRAAESLARTRPVRLFAGNDLYALARKDA